MGKMTALLIPLLFLCAACVSGAELAERVKVLGPLPQGARSVGIRSIPMKPGSIKNVEGLTDPSQLFGRQIKDALAVNQPSWQVVLPDEGGTAPEGDIIAAVELLDIDGGNAGLRFLIGLTAGAAESRVRVTILDKTGKDLATVVITERTMCPVGACVESNDRTIQRNLRNLAGEVAEFVENPIEYGKKKESK